MDSERNLSLSFLLLLLLNRVWGISNMIIISTVFVTTRVWGISNMIIRVWGLGSRV